MASENKLQDQDIKNQINFKIVIKAFPVTADKTATNQELWEATQSLDILKILKNK
jgi:hypothetical protein